MHSSLFFVGFECGNGVRLLIVWGQGGLKLWRGAAEIPSPHWAEVWNQDGEKTR